MSINDPTEFSDQCVIEIIFAFKFQVKGENPKAFDKLSWDSSRCEELLHKLEDKRYLFEEISNPVSNDSIGQIDERIGSFTELIFDTCFSVFGKTVTVGETKPPDKSKKAPWFNTECRAAKDEFLKAKRQFKSSGNDANKLAFLDARKRFNMVKMRAKRHYNHTESKGMTHLSKTAPKQFWRHTNSFRKGK